MPSVQLGSRLKPLGMLMGCEIVDDTTVDTHLVLDDADLWVAHVEVSQENPGYAPTGKEVELLHNDLSLNIVAVRLPEVALRIRHCGGVLQGVANP